MRTHRMPVALLAALAATAVAAGAYAQPADPPADAPEEAPDGVQTSPTEDEDGEATEDEDSEATEEQETDAAEDEDGEAPEDEDGEAPEEQETDAAGDEDGEVAEGQEAPAEVTEPTEPPEATEPPKPATESICGDGIDEDGDGLVDCADPDCAADPVCNEASAAATAPAPLSVQPLEPEADKKTDTPPPPDTTLGLEALAGVTGRVGSMSSGYDASERAGLQYGAGILFAPDRQYAFGLRYIYSGLGSEEFDPAINDTSGKIRRRLHNAAALFRAYPLRNDSIGLWAGLNVGLTWQTASASGSFNTGDISSPAQVYQTDVGPQAGLALGAGLGMDLDLSNDLGMLASLNFTNHRLTSDALDGTAGAPPIPGIGSVSQVDFRLAFQYRFDVSGTPSPVSASVETGSR